MTYSQIRKQKDLYMQLAISENELYLETHDPIHLGNAEGYYWKANKLVEDYGKNEGRKAIFTLSLLTVIGGLYLYLYPIIYYYFLFQ